MAGRIPARRRAPAHRGVLDSLLEGAGDLVQSVVNDVVPGVVDALDMDGVIRQVDVQAVLDRIDMNALLEKVDVNALVARTDLAEIITRSGAGVLREGLDAARSHGVGLDRFIERGVSRLRRRSRREAPDGPLLLLVDNVPVVPAVR